MAKTAMAALSWTYPQDALIALKRAAVATEAAAAVAAGIKVEQLHFNYAVSGDRPAWRPFRAFDDGHQTFIEFPATLAVGKAPPILLVDRKGEAQFVNYRVKGRFYVVDRIFDVAEFRLGTKHQRVVRISRVAEGAPKRGDHDRRGGSRTGDRDPRRTGQGEPALRAQPVRAIRFKRRAVVAIAALGSVSLVATAWVALRPSALYLAGQADGQTVVAKAPTDTLSRLPGSYGDVPKLGPPLPGDLGRPILNHQSAMGTEAASGAAGRADQAAVTERDRWAAELRAARESGLLVQSGIRNDPTRVADATLSFPRQRLRSRRGSQSILIVILMRSSAKPTSSRRATKAEMSTSIG